MEDWRRKIQGHVTLICSAYLYGCLILHIIILVCTFELWRGPSALWRWWGPACGRWQGKIGTLSPDTAIWHHTAVVINQAGDIAGKLHRRGTSDHPLLRAGLL